MKVPEAWVEEHRGEIEREAFRLHGLRRLFARESDTPHDNWITAITNVYKRHELAITKND